MKKKGILSVLLALVLVLAMSSALAETGARSLLKSIEKMGLKGKIIDAPYVVAKDTIDALTDELGEADSANYVAAAKGTYYTFGDAGIVAGVNKGEQVFELRSFDSRLDGIKLKDVKKFFGAPDHVTKTKTELFVSYRITDELNLKFVFSAKGTNPALKHYCVFYPRGTVNMMADDPGRKW